MTTFQVGDSPEVSVRYAAGRFRLANGPVGSITVDISGRPSDGLAVEQHGDRIDISQRPDVRRGRYDVTVTAPAGTRLDVSVASVDVDVDQVGETNLRTASGDVRIAGVTGDIYAKSASGDIRVERVTGNTKLSAASGDCVIGSADGDVQVTCASGDIDAGEISGDGEFKTASGDVDVDCCRGERITVKSASGDVVLGIPRGASVAADLHSLSGTLNLPTASEKNADADGRRVRLRVRSLSGDITLRATD